MVLCGVGDNSFGQLSCNPPSTCISSQGAFQACCLSQAVVDDGDFYSIKGLNPATSSKQAFPADFKPSTWLGTDVILGVLAEDGSIYKLDGERVPMQMSDISCAATSSTGELLLGSRNNVLRLYGLPSQDLSTVTFKQEISLPSCYRPLQIVAGASHFLILAQNTAISQTSLFGYGDNRFRQLGIPSLRFQTKPIIIDFFEGLEISSIACGDQHSIVVSQGAAYIFGSDKEGQCGSLGSDGPELVECEALKDEDVKMAACGGEHTVLLTESGRVLVNGSNTAVQLGLEGVDKQREFAEMPDVTATEIYASKWNTYWMT